jgi:hypothetical protein
VATGTTADVRCNLNALAGEPSRAEEPFDRELRLPGEIPAVQRDDPQHRLIGTRGAGTDQRFAHGAPSARTSIMSGEFIEEIALQSGFR